MPKATKRQVGTSMVVLAKRLEHSRSRIMALRQELQRESDAAAGYLAELQRQVQGMNGNSSAAPAPRGAARAAAGSGKRGRRGGQRDAIVAFIKGKGEPQNADAVAAHLGKTGKMGSVRQALMLMCKAGTLASFKQEDGKYRAPKKGERGGYYGIA